MHEIEALIGALIGVCGVGIGGLIFAVEQMREDAVTAVNRGTQVAITEAKLAEGR